MARRARTSSVDLPACLGPARPTRVRGLEGRVTLCLAPGEPFACADPRLGTRVPGRRGGTITKCAAPVHPDHPTPRRRGEGAYWIEGPRGGGRAMPKSTVRTRLRNAARGGKLVTADSDTAGYWIESILRVPDAERIPAPVGAAYPHRVGSSRCDPQHPLWFDYPMSLAVAETRASIKLAKRKSVTDADVRRATREALQAEAPEVFGEWDSTAIGCASALEEAFARARRSPESTQGRVAAARREYQAQQRVSAGGRVGQELRESREQYANLDDLIEREFGRKPKKRKAR